GRHRHVGENRDAEIAIEHAYGPAAELDVQGIVETEAGPDGFDLGRGGVVAGDDGGRIAGRQMQEQEYEYPDQAHHEQGRDQATDDEGPHARVYAFLAAFARPPRLLAAAVAARPPAPQAFWAFQNGTTPGTASMPVRFLRRAVGATHCPSQTCGTKFQA